jgi:predicted enzyme related to lactoylglutathione lyase
MEKRSALNWFEIPVTDMARAQAFYEKLLATSIRREAMGENELGVFGYDEAGVGGCLIAGATAPRPADRGTMVYLNAGASLDAVLDRLEAAGGLLAKHKVELPGDMGCFAHIIDTEGNRVGLHALK